MWSEGYDEGVILDHADIVDAFVVVEELAQLFLGCGAREPLDVNL